MAGKFSTLLIGLIITAAATGGCEGGTDMATIMGIGDANPTVDELTPPPTPKPTPTPIPTPKPAPSQPPGALKRNVSFDRKRSEGIAQVWEHKTKQAVGTFQAAQRIKPKDVSVKLWLDVIAESARLKSAAMAAKAGADAGVVPGAPMGTVLPPPAVPAAPGALPTTLPGAGAATVGRGVNVPGTAVRADPRLVF